MAVKKEEEKIVSECPIEAAEEETENNEMKKVLTETDPEYWEERVPYKPFYDGKYYKDDISVCVNGERILIKRDIDEPVMIKRKFLHVIENAERQQANSARYEQEHEYVE